ncbi:MAG: hypothetical protein C3F06_14385 [Candidatus Methanoperedenaceae archaeon]|nr:MAG: hypothetical protein C3F06_14385 [Candidatus Methanoperedenaceae archaeon]
MSQVTAIEPPKVMEKVFNILKKELSKEEYLVYLQAITPRIGDATRELGELTEKMNLEDILQKAKTMEKT